MGPSGASRRGEEILVSSNFRPKIHQQKRQCQLERYRDGRTDHHCAINRTVLALTQKFQITKIKTVDC